jgi:hypothetical protein
VIVNVKYWDCKSERKQAFEVRVLQVLEEDLTQVEKTREPLFHPTKGLVTHVSDGLVPRTVTTARPVLNPCFGVWRGKGIFLTQSRNLFPLGIEPRTGEVLLGCLTTTAKQLSLWIVIVTAVSRKWLVGQWSVLGLQT